jgi:hypothetical protein
MTFLPLRRSTRPLRASFLAIVAASGLTALCAFSENVQAQGAAPPAVAPAPRLTLTAEQEYIIREKVPQARSHSFYVKDDEIILVSPSDRRVANVIKKKSTD